MIALAALHGCEFHRAPSGWFVHQGQGHRYLHPLEEHRLNNYTAPGPWGWLTREELARDYCEWFKLL